MPPTGADSEDEYDAYDNFDGVDWSTIPGLDAPTASGSANNGSQATSCKATHGEIQPRGWQPEATQLCLLDQRGDAEDRPSSPRPDPVKTIVDSFEEELTCSICYDIFAAAHLGVPCGHSWCGECGLDWIQREKRVPRCPICRASLSKKAPMSPNYALDSIVEKYVQILGATGQNEWKPGGAKHTQWSLRKRRWKREAAAREAAEKAKKEAAAKIGLSRRGQVVLDLTDFIVPDDDDDEDYDDPEVEELVPIAPRRQPRRHARVHLVGG
ncbi:hypothetical protein PUNSTDRAFT_117342 [Punctularia strigosozonata HHB-11173 SS5]|uniref:uncharacterized protein n=1 Tax=Punctularia strigosozonata (strain HHB-11173) TaxID=741275 RepID=UPI000441839C|nr:uncharacterized protein PUNSTDRAFT_117342 [Punctularia strigosozonata HHB-11173 SS5]EIN13620.1 hypothetical protein PUNSTDRAFT_117342 [Punctularia strigosozonata HHB-11173 SS5]